MTKRLLCFFFLSFFILSTGITSAELGSQAALSTLSNGMQVILLEKHANPLIACMIYVNAGSKYETDQNNGVTHLLEHLLFDGTKTRTRVDITEGIKAKGGYINAFTQKELTCYMVLMPTDYIEDGLAIQSDMLFNSSIPDSELTKERKVVIEEIKKDEDNIDYQVEKYFDSEAYSLTPYARPVIGSEVTISNMTRDEIIDYYHTYYEPNNMIALVIGDFQTDQMKSLLQKYYGQKTAGTIPPTQPVKWTPPSGQEVKYQEVKAENTYVNICFNAPRFDGPDYFDFYMLTEVLNLEASSPLYQALTQSPDPLATQVSAYLETEKEFSSLNLSIITNSPEKVDKILQATVKVLEELTQKPLEQKLLQNVIVSSKTHRYYQEERLHFYGMMAAPVIVTSGWKFWDTFIENLEKVTPETFQQTAKRYFSEPKYIATVVKPAK
ncbi:MAG: pitrilysin family protein [Candidatus Zixiibacteriota bacterium]